MTRPPEAKVSPTRRCVATLATLTIAATSCGGSAGPDAEAAVPAGRATVSPTTPAAVEPRATTGFHHGVIAGGPPLDTVVDLVDAWIVEAA